MKPGSAPGFLAMRLRAPHTPLVAERRAMPEPGPHQVLLRVHACGVCRTDLRLADGEQFMRIADQVPLRVATTRYPLARANEALAALREGRLAGAAVLVP